MLKRAAARTKAAAAAATSSSAAPATTAAEALRPPPSRIAPPPPLPHDYEPVVERVRLRIPHAHVFKLPPKPSSGGWRGADWSDKVWQGALRVVERGDETAVLLVDGKEERNVFAVCPVRHHVSTGGNDGGGGGFDGVDRCVDSSRYFVLRIENAQGRHMFIGLAFNERNDAFDFNTALEDSRREKEAERKAALGLTSSIVKGVDYKMKEGEKIHVSIPRIGSVGSGEDGNASPSGGKSEGSSSAAARRREARKARASLAGNTASGGFLKPSSKDTPSRLA